MSAPTPQDPTQNPPAPEAAAVPPAPEAPVGAAPVEAVDATVPPAPAAPVYVPPAPEQAAPAEAAPYVPADVAPYVPTSVYDGAQSASQTPYQAPEAGGGQQVPPAYQPPQPGQPVYAAGYPGAPAISQKSKLAAGLLGIFLGGLGVHNFYLGRTSRAVIQLLISVVSLGFLAWAVAIWGLVEGILILSAQPGVAPWGVDGRGVPLRD